MHRASKSRRRSDAHSVAVLTGALSNLLRDAEILTDQAMDDLAASRAAEGIPYIPEECRGIRDAVRDMYVRGLTERLVLGLCDDGGSR
jgi:hypothetical protein